MEWEGPRSALLSACGGDPTRVFPGLARCASRRLGWKGPVARPVLITSEGTSPHILGPQVSQGVSLYGNNQALSPSAGVSAWPRMWQVSPR